MSCVPTDAQQNYVEREAHPFGNQHLKSSLFSKSTLHRRAGGLPANATPNDPHLFHVLNSAGDKVKQNLLKQAQETRTILEVHRPSRNKLQL